jgi:hypothetical protein
MTFDEALKNYREKRQILSDLQSTMDKKANERRALSKDLKALHFEYKRSYKELLIAQELLVPELQKEVKSRQMTPDLAALIEDNERE